MPVHHFINDGYLVEKGLKNYWGYNTLAYFGPAAGTVPPETRGSQVAEFKAMVKALHREASRSFSTSSTTIRPRAITLAHAPCAASTTPPITACCPTIPATTWITPAPATRLNVRHPQVLKLIMDSLAIGSPEMHVDGFRFDLAATLARELHDVDRLAASSTSSIRTPHLPHVKLIAEPWDVGEGGYQVGNFPVLWAEWNGKYRDTVRRYWKGDEGQFSDLAYRLTGISDLYQNDGRRPYASINFVTAHDGFTLRDLVSYNEKHNEANGENNQDGDRRQHSWNMGAEGPTEIRASMPRERQMRNLMATLLLSQGVPMLSGGDEIGRTQNGNNNAYCQDNEISWFDWKLKPSQRRLIEFTTKLIQLRRAHPNFIAANSSRIARCSTRR